MEMQRVPAAGYEIKGLPIKGFNRANKLKNFSVLIKLWKSLRLARKIIKEFNPQAAVGVGGYASGATLYECSKMGIPCLIQEQNSYAGVTNKLLAKRAQKICVAYEGMERFFPADKIIMTGNPVRLNVLESPLDQEEARKSFGLSPTKKTIFLVGEASEHELSTAQSWSILTWWRSLTHNSFGKRASSITKASLMP